jgi:hypothetical protein
MPDIDMKCQVRQQDLSALHAGQDIQMKWAAFVGASVWYLWGVYTLSYNPNDFPDPAYANKVWDRRARNTAYLGAAILTAALFSSGNIRSWWVVLLVFLASTFLITILQPALVGLIILGRTGKIMLLVKFGLKPRPPALAPCVWGHYLTEAEKQAGGRAAEDRSATVEKR